MRRILITAHPDDIARWDRLAADYQRRGIKACCSRSGAIRCDAWAARRLHHDMRNELNALSLLENSLRGGQVSPLEAADILRDVVRRTLHMIIEAPDPTTYKVIRYQTQPPVTDQRA